MQLLSHVQLFVAPWTLPGSSVHGVCQAPLSMKFSRQEYWSGLPFPTPEHLPDPAIHPANVFLHFLHWQAGSLPLHYLGRHLAHAPKLPSPPTILEMLNHYAKHLKLK